MRHSSLLALTLAGCILLPVAAPPASYAQAIGYPTTRIYHDAALVPPEHPVDMLRMRLAVSFVPERGLVKGTVTHTFRPLRPRVDSLFFHGPGIRVARASLNGQPVRFSISSGGITVYPVSPLHWGSADSITFVYEATPRRGIYFIGWNDTTGRRRRQIWTQGQGIDNRHWFPCYDEQNDKLITETIVTFDARYEVLSNGRKIAEQPNPDGTKTWHYVMEHPHASYLVMLGIGDYRITTVRTRTGVPVRLYWYPGSEERVEPTYRYSAECVDFVAEHTGVPYPWSTYANIPVEDFLYGAMENTTATVYGDALLVDARAYLDKSYIGTNVHELAHQWFGDYVTGRSSIQAWLHESFATFYSKLFFRKIAGDDEYQWIRHLEQEAALQASERNRLPLVHSAAGRERVYQKGSAVLDMMMDVFGEDAFRRVVNHYLRHHAYGLVETNDLFQSFQDTLGLAPAWFFDQWIYRGGEPHYEVAYRDLSARGNEPRRTEITVRQVHARDELVGLFSMPVNFEVHYMDGSIDRVRAVVAQETERVVVPNMKGAAIAFVLFDPGGIVLKKVSFARSFAELRRQAMSAPQMIDRYDAVAALRAYPLGERRQALIDVYRKEKFHAVRAEAAAQLANDTVPASRMLVEQALRDSHVDVRLAMIDSIRVIPAALRAPYEALLHDSSYAIVTTALRRLAEAFPDGVERYLAVTKDDIGVGHQARVTWHTINAARGDSGSLRTLATMVGPGYEFRTRVNAMDALRRLNHLDETAAAGLFDALVNANARLRGPAVELVRYFQQQERYGRLLRSFYASRSWEPREAALVEQAMAGS